MSGFAPTPSLLSDMYEGLDGGHLATCHHLFAVGVVVKALAEMARSERASICRGGEHDHT
jgi:hypothetical protein